MFLVSAIRRLGGKAAPEDRSRFVESRAAPRYVFHRAIRFMRKGAAPAFGSLLNLSEDGALTRIRIPDKTHLPPWPLRLVHGDELWLADLIDLPLHCWVIEAEVGLVRVRLLNDGSTRPLLHALIARLASSEQSQRDVENNQLASAAALPRRPETSSPI